MERETEKITIGKHEFVIKTYANARETQAIQRVYFTKTKTEVVGDKPHITEFDPTVQFEVNEAMVQNMVVSMDGSAENLVDRCLDLANDLYTELIAEISERTSKKN